MKTYNVPVGTVVYLHKTGNNWPAQSYNLIRSNEFTADQCSIFAEVDDSTANVQPGQYVLTIGNLISGEPAVGQTIQGDGIPSGSTIVSYIGSYEDNTQQWVVESNSIIPNMEMIAIHCDDIISHYHFWKSQNFKNDLIWYKTITPLSFTENQLIKKVSDANGWLQDPTIPLPPLTPHLDELGNPTGLYYQQFYGFHSNGYDYAVPVSITGVITH